MRNDLTPYDGITWVNTNKEKLDPEFFKSFIALTNRTIQQRHKIADLSIHLCSVTILADQQVLIGLQLHNDAELYRITWRLGERVNYYAVNNGKLDQDRIDALEAWCLAQEALVVGHPYTGPCYGIPPHDKHYHEKLRLGEHAGVPWRLAVVWPRPGRVQERLWLYAHGQAPQRGNFSLLSNSGLLSEVHETKVLREMYPSLYFELVDLLRDRQIAFATGEKERPYDATVDLDESVSPPGRARKKETQERKPRLWEGHAPTGPEWRVLTELDYLDENNERRPTRWLLYVMPARGGWINLKLVAAEPSLRKANYLTAYSVNEQRLTKNSETAKLQINRPGLHDLVIAALVAASGDRQRA